MGGGEKKWVERGINYILYINETRLTELRDTIPISTEFCVLLPSFRVLVCVCVCVCVSVVGLCVRVGMSLCLYITQMGSPRKGTSRDVTGIIIFSIFKKCGNRRRLQKMMDISL